MLSDLYDYFRGSIGLALCVAGLVFWIEPERQRIRQAFGLLFIASGILFILSALDKVLNITFELSNIIIFLLILCISLSVLEIELYVFGGENKPGARRTMLIAAFIWTATLFMFGLIDYAFISPTILTSVEDGKPLGPFHFSSSVCMYLLPVFVSVRTLWLGKWNPHDIPIHARSIRPIKIGLLVIAVVLFVIILSIAFSSKELYRLSHTMLELLLLACFFYLVAKPSGFFTIRNDIQDRHNSLLRIGDSEAAIIEERLEKYVINGNHHFKSAFNLNALAKIIQIPPYRLSRYFNSCLSTTFPAWLNNLRIQHVCQVMIHEPNRNILDIAMNAGYNSKAVFNAQFQKVKGMTPTEYRKANVQA